MNKDKVGRWHRQIESWLDLGIFSKNDILSMRQRAIEDKDFEWWEACDRALGGTTCNSCGSFRKLRDTVEIEGDRYCSVIEMCGTHDKN